MSATLLLYEGLFGSVGLTSTGSEGFGSSHAARGTPKLVVSLLTDSSTKSALFTLLLPTSIIVSQYLLLLPVVSVVSTLLLATCSLRSNSISAY